MSERTRAGLLKVRPAGAGSRVGVIAPASPFDRDEFDLGLTELRRLGFEPVFDDRIFERRGYVAGEAASRAAQLRDLWRRADVDAIVAVRGGYGSAQALRELSLADATAIRGTRTAMIGYSDMTSVHVWLATCASLVSIHGPMIDRRLSAGPQAYDPASLLASLQPEPMGLLTPDGVEVLKGRDGGGEAEGPLFGGTLTQVLASLGTPWAFDPPSGYVLFLDEVGERPYRLDRMVEQLRQSGLLARASAVVCGQLPQCDEPGGLVTAKATMADVLSDFPGPVLFGFPAGHSVTPLVTLPFGVHTRVLTGVGAIGLSVEEAAVEGGA